jgi:asparagine synthase (glutamine-hydrolysing)
MAAAACRAGSQRLFPVTFTFERLPECDERQFTQPLARSLGLELAEFPVDRCWLFEKPETLPAPLETAFQGWEAADREMCRSLRSNGCRALLTGQVGDYGSVGHDRLAYVWRLLRGDARVISEVLRRGRSLGWSPWQSFVRCFLRPVLPKALISWSRRFRGLTSGSGLPEWVCPAIAVHGEPPPGETGPTGLRRLIERDSLPARARFMLRGAAGEIVYWHDRGCAACGIEARHPFLDRRLVEYTARLPPEQIFRAGWDRIFLRRAVKGLLPDRSRLRSERTFFTSFTNESLRAYFHHLTEPEIRRWLTVRSGIIDPERLLGALRQCQGGHRRFADLYSSVLLELWLSENRASLAVCIG